MLARNKVLVISIPPLKSLKITLVTVLFSVNGVSRSSSRCKTSFKSNTNHPAFQSRFVNKFEHGGGGGCYCTVRSKLKKFEHICGWIPIHCCAGTFPPCEENGRQTDKTVMKIRQVTVAIEGLHRYTQYQWSLKDILAGRVHKEMGQQLVKAGRLGRRRKGRRKDGNVVDGGDLTQW